MRINFTEEEVLAEVRKIFDEDICLDMMEDARTERTIEDAASLIICDSALWNGTW
jgi:hypothetical protein